ncbi:ATP-binding protein [Ferrimonas marina]|uniref:histidine kinase n=2 Tax=Ferrimonas marina TaxID=299255 RepID=A0A1M5NSR1_9GAMM|nr:ATP-binding protein [Ferrimonas marina]SHG92485.1 two-component system, OmpR family, sensor histidine kinase BaeS [Ferrimonas marina]
MIIGRNAHIMSLASKLILAFVGVTLVVLSATLLLARWSFERGFLEYVDAVQQSRLEQVAQELAERFQQDGGWQQVDSVVLARLLRGPVTELPPPPRGDHPPLGHAGPPPHQHQVQGTWLIDHQGQLVAGQPTDSLKAPITAGVWVQDQEVGRLNSAPRQALESPQETAFSRQQFSTSVLIALFSLGLALLVSTQLTRRLLAPVRRMASGVHAMTQGEFQYRLAEPRRDELGALMADLDHLAETLEQGRSARQRWLASISHELRTPTTILTGELEAIRDGIRPLDLEQIDSMAAEVARLRRLIDDLYQLSLSDVGGLRYQFAPLDLAELVKQRIASFDEAAKQAGVAIALTLPESVPLHGDATRLQQLVDNLISNSLAYTDPPGRLQVSLSVRSKQAVLVFADSSPGATEDECQQLFEPLYRLEPSRSRRAGGAGLGLAICHNIVVAHRGWIRAEPASLGGLAISVSLPIR